MDVPNRRRSAYLALLGVALGLGALVAGLLGSDEGAALLAGLAAIVLMLAWLVVMMAFMGGLRSATQRTERPGEAFTGETAWVRAMLRDHPTPWTKPDGADRR